MWVFQPHKNNDTDIAVLIKTVEVAKFLGIQKADRIFSNLFPTPLKTDTKTEITPGKRFELLRCRAPVAFKATAFPD